MIRKLAGMVGRGIGRLVGANGPRTFDYTTPNRCFDHDYKVVELRECGLVLIVTGWGEPGIKAGDYLVFSRDGGGVVDLPPTTRYRVVTIQYRDSASELNMWDATLRSAPISQD